MPAEVILVVDDEPVVLSSVAGTLKMAGFPVLCASSPRQALRIGISCREAIHLMVCDVLMPEMTGPVLAGEFSLIHPETRFLFMAGLPDHPEVRDRILAARRAFLAKPFLPRDLVSQVEELLGVVAARSMAAGS